ncbi:MAG: hypothetical protein JXB17_09505, partial [Bacteroidales bacterium]|nr:hypothetical protein [Bacteroidales bacterium]
KTIIIAFSLILLSNSLFAKKIENKQFALFDYEVIIDEEFRTEIKALDSYINSIRGYMGKKQDKLEGKIYDMTYPPIEEKLEQRYSIDILPVNSYTENINYNPYGYPKTSIKKAQELGYSHFYLKISVYITTTTPKAKDAKNSIMYKNKTCPKVTVEVEVYEKIGIIPVGKAIGEAQSSTPQRVEDRFLLGIVQPIEEDDVSELDETLFALILKAIDNMLISFDKNI